MLDKNIGAFFDIDGTIFRNALMIEHYKKLIRYDVVDPVTWHRQIKHIYSEWEKRYGDFDEYLEALAQIYLDELKGLNKSEIDFVARQVIDINWDKVYRFSRERIAWHQEKEHKVFFISGSPDFLVAKMAEKYRVDDFNATKYILDKDGNFTGEIFRMWDHKNKKKALNDLVEKYNIDLDKSYAYGDTNGDLSMLKMVGNPIAVNPNKELFLQIKKDKDLAEKTAIIVERKDIIYKLDSGIDIY